MSLLDFISSPINTSSKSSVLDTVSKPVSSVVPQKETSSGGALGFFKDLFSGGDDTTGGLVRNTITGLPKAAVEVGKDIARSAPRSLAAIMATASGEKQIQATTPGDKFVFGSEPVNSISEQSRIAQETLERFGVSKGTASVAAPAGVVGSIALDLFPGTSGKGSLLKNLAKETSETAIKGILKEVKSITPEIVESVTPRIAAATTEKEVKSILETAAAQATTPPVPKTPVDKLLGAVREAKPVNKDIAAMQTAERSRRAALVEETLGKGKGEEGYISALSKLKGELTPDKPTITPVRDQLDQTDVDSLFRDIHSNTGITTFEKIAASNGLAKILGGEIPRPSELSLLEDVFGSAFVKEVQAKRGNLSKVRDLLTEAVNLPRALITSLDFSAPLRQGLMLTVSKPKQSLPAFKEMFKMAFSEKRFNEWLDQVKQTPNYQLMRESGLYISDPRKLALSEKEESFMTNLAEKIPVYGQFVKGSQRAYVGYLNKLRVDVFNDLLGKFQQSGVADPKTIKSLASFVNNATGRGDLGKLGRVSQELNNVFFSPRLIASRLNLLNPVWYAKQPKPVRMEAIKSFGSLIATGTTILALAKLGGAEVEDDPRSSDFGKIKIGNTRWDIWGGFQQWARVFAQLLTGERKTTKGNIQKLSAKSFPFETRLDVLGNFARGKLAPTPALALELLAGQKLYGGDLSVQEEAISNIVPLYLQDMKEAIKQEGASAILTHGAPSVFGVGVQTYTPTGSAQSNIAAKYGVATAANPAGDILKRYKIGTEDDKAADILKKYNIK